MVLLGVDFLVLGEYNGDNDDDGRRILGVPCCCLCSCVCRRCRGDDFDNDIECLVVVVDDLVVVLDLHVVVVVLVVVDLISNISLFPHMVLLKY